MSTILRCPIYLGKFKQVANAVRRAPAKLTETPHCVNISTKTLVENNFNYDAQDGQTEAFAQEVQDKLELSRENGRYKWKSVILWCKFGKEKFWKFVVPKRTIH